MPHVNVNDVNLYYEVHGEGVPLMLIAGLASDSQSWELVLEGLAKDYQVIVLDNRGVGRTRPHDVQICITSMAEDCFAIANYLGLTTVNLLGHSMGGFVALKMALRYPDFVSKLILVGTSVSNSERNNALFGDWSSYLKSGMDAELWFRNIFYWIYSKSFFMEESQLDAALRLAIDYPYPQTSHSFHRQVEAIKGFECQDALSTLTATTLVLNGNEDLLFSPEESATALSSIPGVVSAIVEGAAHALHVEKPEIFVRVVKGFLSSGSVCR